MNKLKNILVFSILFISYNTLSYCQQGSAKKCINAEPLCASTLFSYPNTSGINFAENGPDYGCLSVAVNPAWFYFQMASDGDIQLKISQSTVLNGTSDLDVDFITYGPFNDPVLPCEMDLQAVNITDCSYKLDFVEYLNISNAMAGDYYLLLITNFSLVSGFITVEQTLGAASTNCNLLNEITKISEIACEGEEIILEVPSSANHFIWYENDGSGTNNFDKILNANSATYNVTSTNIYRAEAYNSDNVFLEAFEFDATFYKKANLPINIKPYNICDTLGDNNEMALFDLSTKNEELLNGLNPLDFMVTYHKTIEDANSGFNPLPFLYTNSQQTETIYVRVKNSLNPDLDCYDVTSFSITVNKLPSVNLYDTYILCVNTNGTENRDTPPIIDTSLTTVDYNFVWRLNGVVLPLEGNGLLVPVEGGNYTVTVTNNITGCFYIEETTVIESEPPIVTAKVISNTFTEDNNVSVEVFGTDVYEFSFDKGPWQESTIFNNVPMGEHIITARNTNGCGETSITITVIDYPHYFTPNGDGTHDTWNITDPKNQLQAKIYIYNRYGKLLNQLVSNGMGWDGTLNGSMLPTDDYWFTIEYIDPKDKETKLFKSHFTLKR